MLEVLALDDLAAVPDFDLDDELYCCPVAQTGSTPLLRTTDPMLRSQIDRTDQRARDDHPDRSHTREDLRVRGEQARQDVLCMVATGDPVRPIEPDKVDWITRRARFNSQVPLEYAYNAWGELPLPDATFDRVLSAFMLHHLDADERLRAFREIRRVLRPGGQLHVVDVDGARDVRVAQDLLVGQTAAVRVTTGSAGDVLRVPSTAVHDIAGDTGTVLRDGVQVKVGVGLRGDQYTAQEHRFAAARTPP